MQIKSFEEIKREDRMKRINSLKNHPSLSNKQKEVMKSFHMQLIKKQLRLDSQKAYIQNLKLLFDGIPDALNPTDKSLDEYLTYIGKFKPKTQTERMKFLKEFYLKYRKSSPRVVKYISGIKIKRNKDRKLPEELLSPKEIKKLVQVADNFRDKAIIILLYETAARKGEFLQLKIKHIDITEDKKKKYAFITIPKGKTDSRKLPIIYSLPHVLNWLNSHPERDDPNAPLFITQGAWLGRAFGEDGLKIMVKVLGKRAKIKKNIYPHLFRHSRLTELAKELTEQELKKFAGWTADSEMAATYVHLSQKEVGDKILANAGLIDSALIRRERNELLQIVCPGCKEMNSADNKLCSTCGRVLDLKQAQVEIEKFKEKDSELNVLKTNMTRMQKRMDEQMKILEALAMERKINKLSSA